MFSELLEKKTIIDDSTPGKTKIEFLLDKGGNILDAQPSLTKASALALLKEMKNVDEDNAAGYSNALTAKLAEMKNRYPAEYASTTIVFDETKVAEKVTYFATELKANGAQIIEVNAGGKTVKKYVLLLSELQLARSATANIPPASVAAWTGFLRNLGETIDSVKIGYAWTPAKDTAIRSDKEVRTYVLTNAKMKNDNWYSPYASAEELLSAFLETEVYLVKDQFSQDFFEDFVENTQVPNAYKSNLQTAKISAQFVKNTLFRKSADKVETNTLPLPVEAGKYPVSMYVEWKGSTDTDFLLDKALPFINTLEGTPLAAITTSSGDELAYEDNIFFQLPFDGTTGYTSTDGRNAYGMDIAYLANQSLAGVKGNAYVKKGYATLSTLNELAGLVERTGKPTLVELNDDKLTLAPSTPVALRAQVSNANGIAALQYYFQTPSVGNNVPFTLTGSPILWNDCTKKSGGTVNVVMGGTCRGDLDAFSQSIHGSTIGNEYFYSGVALVPTDQTYFLDLVCANNAAVVKGPPSGKEYSVDNTPDADIESVPLSNADVTKIKSLKQALDQVFKGDACASLKADAFSIIWDVTSTKVVPQDMQCSATPLNT